MKLYGGLTSKTSIYEIPARSNAAIALLLAGRKEDARQYMAMTGAGRLGNEKEFRPAEGMSSPDCGGDAGLKPDDVAVVEFSIGNNGEVIEASPVYAVGGGAVALEFARAAKSWSWNADVVKKMPGFFRTFARVELRCNLAFQRPSIQNALDDDLIDWLEAKGMTIPPIPTGSAAAALPGQRAALARAESAGASSLAVVAPLLRLIQSELIGREEAHLMASRALAIAGANNAPPTARLALDYRKRTLSSADSGEPKYTRRINERLLADYSADPKAGAAVRLMAFDSEGSKKKVTRQSQESLQRIVDDPALAARDALKVGAMIRLASLEQANGNIDAARANFTKTGLDASQCALLDSPPTLLRHTGEYPNEALRWHFEGWTVTQHDVDAAGRTLNQRVIMSYPPFVFSDAGRGLITHATFSKSYRPDGGLGCSANDSRVSFALPY